MGCRYSATHLQNFIVERTELGAAEDTFPHLLVGALDHALRNRHEVQGAVVLHVEVDGCRESEAL
jgi:hypothetical protein